MTVVVVGRNSFLAKGMDKNGCCKNWIFLSHGEISGNEHVLKEADTVINFAFDPVLSKDAYDEARDTDTRIANIIRLSRTSFVMMSTRMVYGAGKSDGFVFSENHEPKPVTAYGINKKITEDSIRSLLGDDRVCILRLANIFGDEAGRRTFFGTALKNLRETGVMTFDIAPDSVRDFLPVTYFQDFLLEIAENFKSGVYNLGSGFGATCYDVTRWIIDGYGSGRADFTSTMRKGDFILNMEKTKKTFLLPAFENSDLERACRRCGEVLRQGLSVF